MTITLSHEPVKVGDELLISIQLRADVTDPDALDTHALVADLYNALAPAGRVVEKFGTTKAISLSVQPYNEEDDNDLGNP